MEPSSIGILIVAVLLVVEIVVMLVKFKVDKMLLLLPLIGVVLTVISFVSNVYRGKILSSVAGAAPYIVYVTLASGVIFGFVSFVVWFKGEKEARKLASTVKSIDSAVTGIESDLRGSSMELEHFEEEMSSIKTKIQDYETKEKGV